MARSINEIQESLAVELKKAFPNLSGSKAAEWLTVAWVVAAAIHTFELLLDVFRKETDATVSRATVGTRAWHAERARRFQLGHTLEYDSSSALFFYAKDDPQARIVKKVVVSEGEKSVTVKVAKTDTQGKIVPLSEAERQDFVNYMSTTSFAGIPTNVISTNPDTIRYRLEIYHNPGYPVDTVKTRVKDALDEFKTSLDFDSKFYPQHLIACLVNLQEVVTVNPVKIEHRYGAGAYQTVGVEVELISGYFEYANDCELTLISV